MSVMSDLFAKARLVRAQIVNADGVPSGTLDSSGAQFNPDSLPQTITRNANGTVATIVATNGANTWTQTFSYPNSTTTTISSWVKT